MDISIDFTPLDKKIMIKKIFPNHNKSLKRTRDENLQNRVPRLSTLAKNALMVLNEAKGLTISKFAITSHHAGGFNAVVTVNSIQYVGYGPSKMSAKHAASEKAWRDYILDMMNPEDEDDIPTLNLASFAIHKLFTEWERYGYHGPEMVPSMVNASLPAAGGDATSPPPSVRHKKKKSERTELPSGWETMHPASILCIMRPSATYEYYGPLGDLPNVLQHVGIVVDGEMFTASGRSKKIARRNVAVKVCNLLFGTNFSTEDTGALATLIPT